MPEKCPLLEMSGIVKRFPGVLALDDARLEVREGEILGLVGENGAGKSTLMKILCGAIPRDGGVIRVTGREVAIRSPQDAHALGIRMVHQEFNLVPKLSVAENILLGRLGTGRLVNWSRVRAEAETVLNRLNMSMDVTAPVGTLSIAQQQ
ncbi:MAG TPA: ATP-binding cassette domain-containing protein, partial [Candidatus Hydrogenedentes bacterium]|nr:ATP-binding cassette domain-containing protein [Candidatus Hydrogenedentota bacterium]